MREIILIICFLGSAALGILLGYKEGIKEGMLIVAGNEEVLRAIELEACRVELAQAMKLNPVGTITIKGSRCNRIMAVLNHEKVAIEVGNE